MVSFYQRMIRPNNGAVAAAAAASSSAPDDGDGGKRRRAVSTAAPQAQEAIAPQSNAGSIDLSTGRCAVHPDTVLRSRGLRGWTTVRAHCPQCALLHVDATAGAGGEGSPSSHRRTGRGTGRQGQRERQHATVAVDRAEATMALASMAALYQQQQSSSGEERVSPSGTTKQKANRKKLSGGGAKTRREKVGSKQQQQQRQSYQDHTPPPQIRTDEELSTAAVGPCNREFKENARSNKSNTNATAAATAGAKSKKLQDRLQSNAAKLHAKLAESAGARGSGGTSIAAKSLFSEIVTRKDMRGRARRRATRSRSLDPLEDLSSRVDGRNKTGGKPTPKTQQRQANDRARDTSKFLTRLSVLNTEHRGEFHQFYESDSRLLSRSSPSCAKPSGGLGKGNIAQSPMLPTYTHGTNNGGRRGGGPNRIGRGSDSSRTSEELGDCNSERFNRSDSGMLDYGFEGGGRRYSAPTNLPTTKPIGAPSSSSGVDGRGDPSPSDLSQSDTALFCQADDRDFPQERWSPPKQPRKNWTPQSTKKKVKNEPTLLCEPCSPEPQMTNVADSFRCNAKRNDAMPSPPSPPDHNDSSLTVFCQPCSRPSPAGDGELEPSTDINGRTSNAYLNSKYQEVTSLPDSNLQPEPSFNDNGRPGNAYLKSKSQEVTPASLDSLLPPERRTRPDPPSSMSPLNDKPHMIQRHHTAPSPPPTARATPVSVIPNMPKTREAPVVHDQRGPQLQPVQRSKSSKSFEEHNYRLGDKLQIRSHAQPFKSSSQATILMTHLPLNSPLFVKRSNNEWTYATLVGRLDNGQGEMSVVVVLNENGKVKKVLEKSKWEKCLRLVASSTAVGNAGAGKQSWVEDSKPFEMAVPAAASLDMGGSPIGATDKSVSFYDYNEGNSVSASEFDGAQGISLDNARNENTSLPNAYERRDSAPDLGRPTMKSVRFTNGSSPNDLRRIGSMNNILGNRSSSTQTPPKSDNREGPYPESPDSVVVNLHAKHFCGSRRDRMRPAQRKSFAQSLSSLDLLTGSSSGGKSGRPLASSVGAGSWDSDPQSDTACAPQSAMMTWNSSELVPPNSSYRPGIVNNSGATGMPFGGNRLAMRLRGVDP